MIWKKIQNEDLKYDYLISSTGIVKRLETPVTINCKRKGCYKTIRKEKIMKNTTISDGYVVVTLQTKKRSKAFYLHRLLATHFLENPDNKLQVNHLDGDKHDYNLFNLEWSTPSENEQHAYDTGLKKGCKGTNNGMSKLSEAQVVDIKTSLSMNISPTQIAKSMNINRNIVYKIKSGLRWKHIKKNWKS
jgi:hypothetical protein